MTELRLITAADAEMVYGFLNRLPEGDRTFFKEDTSADTVDKWTHDERNRRWILIDKGVPAAMVAIMPGVGWSSHVAELRLVVGSDFRRRGIGRRLARHGLTEAVRLGQLKIVVEVVADKDGDIEMFTSIGFRPEALLQNQIRDQNGELHDLVLLSHDVADVAASMDVLGLDEAVGTGTGA
jgi:ribosomal protein S18 acetylase RimI-like enzyme